MKGVEAGACHGGPTAWGRWIRRRGAGWGVHSEQQEEEEEEGLRRGLG